MSIITAPIEEAMSSSRSPSPAALSYESDNSVSSLEGTATSIDEPHTSSIYAYHTYSIEEHVATLRSIQNDDTSNTIGIKALPRRANKSQRPFAIQISKALFPQSTEISAIIEYERLVIPAKAAVRQRERDLLALDLLPKDNRGGKLIRIQGPWAGQEADPVDLRGPTAIPMPVEIGTTRDFEPIFAFLAQDTPFDVVGTLDDFKPTFNFTVPDGAHNGTRGHELLWNSPLVEFERGIVYDDGRLDLCKKVVGPTHIGKLMESLESNNQITHFLLGNNAISTTGANAIAKFLAQYPNRMETWYLAGCHITSHGLELLVPQLVKSSKITNLWFKRNPFGPESAPLLAQLVLCTSNLRTLDLETTQLGDEGVSRFIDAITGKPSSLKHIYLNANGIGQKASAALAEYLSHPTCVLESLFMSTNPIGDAGIALLAPALRRNKTLKRLTLASTGLTSKGVSVLAAALSQGPSVIHTLDLGASQTTKAHGQKFNYLDDACIEALNPLILSPSLRWLNLGRTLFSAAASQDIKATVAQSSLVYFAMNTAQVSDASEIIVSTDTTASTTIMNGTAAPKSCSLAVRNRLARNQAKLYPHIKDYDSFLNSEEIRFLRNTSDVRKIDSMYRTRDKRLGLPMDVKWEKGDATWKLIVDDAEAWRLGERGSAV